MRESQESVIRRADFSNVRLEDGMKVKKDFFQIESWSKDLKVRIKVGFKVGFKVRFKVVIKIGRKVGRKVGRKAGRKIGRKVVLKAGM